MSGSNTRVSDYFGKMSGSRVAVNGVSLQESIISGLGSAVGIGLCSYLSVSSGYPWLTAPFGATSALIFAAFKSPLAQPRNVVGGYLVSALSGLLILTFLGRTWWTPAIGVGLAIFGMVITRTLHPPAGGVPIVIITAKAGWLFLLKPILIGSVTLVVVAILYNNLFRNRRYPEYW